AAPAGWRPGWPAGWAPRTGTARPWRSARPSRTRRSAGRAAIAALASAVPEAVPDAAHREDERRLPGIRLDLLAQVTDVHVHRARLAVGRVAPHRLEQRLARVHAAG